MARILITSGPTRQYLDPVRYLSNASSGRMGQALAAAAIEAGHQVVVVSGPVAIRYPRPAEVIPVVSTEEMLAACLAVFPGCDGLIAVPRPATTGRGRWQRPRSARRAGRWKSSWWKRPTSSPAWQDQRRPVDGGLRPGDRGPAFAGVEKAGAEELRLDRRQRPGGDRSSADAGRGARTPAARCWPPWPAASAAWRGGFLKLSPSGCTSSTRIAAVPGDQEHVGGDVDLFAQAVDRAVGHQVVDDGRSGPTRGRRPAGSTAARRRFCPSYTLRRCLPQGR